MSTEVGAESLENWEQVVENLTDVVTPRSAEALHGLLDAEGPPPRSGAPLPPLWHWLAFLPVTPQRDLGIDGHPRIGTFLPKTGLPRRMFAGGNLEFIRTAKVGEVLIRKSRVVSVVEKSGRSGKLVFVSVAHEIMSEEGPLINETQNLVYREGERFGPTPLIMDPRAKETSWNWSHELMMDSALMFRFSALTYNAHRIHYDRDYASRVEGYPDLVVQGPLLAVVLAEICRRNVGSRDLERFVFQVHSPSFVGGSVHFKGRLINTDNVELLSFSEAGQLTVSALATFRVGGEEY